MKTLTKLVLATTLATVAGTAMAADKKVVTDAGVATFSFFKPASVRAEVGTLGYGAAVSYNVNSKVALTAGYNGGDISWTDGLSVSDKEYEMEMKNNNVYLNAEIRPFANPFYVAAGVGYIDAEYKATERLTNTNDVVKIDGRNYHAPTGTGSFTGQVSYDNKIAPYVGLGFAPATTSRFGAFGEVGAYYVGNPDAKFNSDGLVEVGGTATGADAAAQEENSFRNDDKHAWLPVAKLGVSYRF